MNPTKQKGDSQPAAKVKETNATYKFPNAFKGMVASIVDPYQRGHFRRMVIDANVTAQKHAAEAAKKREKKD